MASKQTPDSDSLPFGAMPEPGARTVVGKSGEKKSRSPRARKDKDTDSARESASDSKSDSPQESSSRGETSQDGGKPSRRRGSSRRGGGRGRREGATGGDDAPSGSPEGGGGNRQDGGAREGAASGEAGEGSGSSRRRRQSRWRKKRRGGGGGGEGGGQGRGDAPGTKGERPQNQRSRGGGGGGDRNKGRGAVLGEVEGILVIEHAKHGSLRVAENGYFSKKTDIHVPPRASQRYGLRDGCLVKATYGKGFGRHKFDLIEVLEVDGRTPKEAAATPNFKSLTSIDPDFHYAVGTAKVDVGMSIVDLICPVGRGQRGLIVAPPRSGKTILLQHFAKSVEKLYPDVHLMVLLVDERPEEATEWRRSTNGEVFVSTNDEMPKTHVELAEVVWRRCRRLVELGEDVILLLDSITRLGRAYNNVHGNSGRTMSGGLDTRALERPKQFFGSARNTETAGSLTILGTTLIDTGSQMDRVIFEEFKGTGNMELVLSRKLADRRIFPAIDVERSGTRKEEKLISMRRLRLMNTLRRVLARMHFAEAMELLITKLDQFENVDDFLARFEIDPEA